MEKLKSFVSKKFIFGMILIFWVPIVAIKMVEAQVPQDALFAIVVGLFSIGGVYSFVQGMIDKAKK